MATNDEIVKKYNLASQKYLENALDEARAAEQADMAKTNKIHEKYHELNDKDIEEKVKKDTAKQIFAELESIKDEYDNPLLDTLYGKGEQYKALKKKYKVD